MRFAQSLGLTFILGALALHTPTAEAKPGDHIRVGKTVIIPSLRLGFQVRSNAFRTQSQAQLGGNFSIRPGLNLALDTPDLTVNADASYTARKFVFLSNPGGFGDEVRRSQIRALDRFNSFTAGLRLSGFRTRQFGLALSDRAVVQNNPNDNDIEGDHPYVSQLRNTLAGSVAFRPGPAVETRLGAQWGWARFFLPSTESPRSAYNTRNSYGPQASVKWLFLPRTAWVLNVNYTYNNWVDDQPPEDDEIPVATPDSHFIQANTGIQGRITTRLRVVARAGYGVGIYQGDDPGTNGIGGLLLTLQGTYELSDDHAITAGYRKSFFDSYFTNVTQTNALYAGWDGKYGDRVTSSLKYGLRFEDFRGLLSRNDIVNQLQLRIGVDATAWMNIGLNGSWLQRRSSDDFVEYDDVRGGLGLTFSY